MTHIDFKRCSRHVNYVNKLWYHHLPEAPIVLATEEPKLEQIGVTCLTQGHFAVALDGGNSPLHSLPLMQIFLRPSVDLSQYDVLVTRPPL